MKKSITYAIKVLTIHRDMVKYFNIKNNAEMCDDVIQYLKAARRKLRNGSQLKTTRKG